MNCSPTRMALPRRSRPSGCGLCSRFQRVMTTAAASESTALTRKTQALPALAIRAPAASGPMMREAFMDTPLSASAAGNWARGTSSGTMAANTGQRMARPTPLANVSTSSSRGDSAPRNIVALRSVATTATQIWVTRK